MTISAQCRQLIEAAPDRENSAIAADLVAIFPQLALKAAMNHVLGTRRTLRGGTPAPRSKRAPRPQQPARKVEWDEPRRDRRVMYEATTWSSRWTVNLYTRQGNWTQAFYFYGDEPSRRTVARKIRQYRRGRPFVGARWEDGTLRGIRYFRVGEHVPRPWPYSDPTDTYVSRSFDVHSNGRLSLVSPHQDTVWESAVMVAQNWSNSDAVRAKAGLHAAWPASGKSIAKAKIDYRARRGYVWSDGSRMSDVHLRAEVAGYGDFVAGSTGWRSEKMIIVRIYIPAKYAVLAPRLAKEYPDVELVVSQPKVKKEAV